MEPIRVMHFSDTLCVWAYVSQIRIDELLRNFAGSVELEYRYLHVFGDVPKKMEASWKDRGGAQGYNEHVRTVGDAALEAWVFVASNPSADPLHPYSWYKRFLVEGAREHGLPASYTEALKTIEATADSDRERDRRKRALNCEGGG